MLLEFWFLLLLPPLLPECTTSLPHVDHQCWAIYEDLKIDAGSHPGALLSLQSMGILGMGTVKPTCGVREDSPTSLQLAGRPFTLTSF